MWIDLEKVFNNYKAGVPVRMLLGFSNETIKSNFLNNMYKHIISSEKETGKVGVCAACHYQNQ